MLESLAAVVRLAALAEKRTPTDRPRPEAVEASPGPTRPRLAGQLARFSQVGRPDTRGDLRPYDKGRNRIKDSRFKISAMIRIGFTREDPNEHEQSMRRRIVSLDQFRGYTVVGMLLVNFLGGYQVVPAVFKHHNTYCSYADTIMPQFFFAVGFAYRLTFLRRLANGGFLPAAAAVIKRNIGLILLGFVIYHLDGSVKSWAELQKLGMHGFLAQAFRREIFQTLVHIAITSIWILPVIAAGASIRILFMIFSAGLHLWLSSLFYFDWAWKTPVIDGGQLGFLSWTIPTLVGSLAYDAMTRDHEVPACTETGRLVGRVDGRGIWDLVPGRLLSAAAICPPCPKPRVDLWTMSQRTGSIAYLTFRPAFRWRSTRDSVRRNSRKVTKEFIRGHPHLETINTISRKAAKPQRMHAKELNKASEIFQLASIVYLVRVFSSFRFCVSPADAIPFGQRSFSSLRLCGFA